MVYRRWLGLVLALGWLVGGGITAVSAQQPMPLADYWQALETLRERVANGERLAVAAQLEQLTAVSLPNGEIVTLDHTILRDALSVDDADTDQLLDYFDALLALRSEKPAVPRDAADLAPLFAILQRAEFQYEVREPGTLAQWWQDLQDRFWNFIGRLFPDPNSPLGQVAEVVVTFGGAALMIFVLAVALRNIVGGLVAEANLQVEEAEAEFLTADSAFARAQELSAGGDYRTAVRYLYLSALLLLEEQGLLRYDRSRTNREYLRSVAHKPELARILREVVEVFDRVWYGYQPLNKADYDAYVQRVEALKQQR